VVEKGRLQIIKNIYPKIVDSLFISAKVAPLCVTDQAVLVFAQSNLGINEYRKKSGSWS
jgi:hypothetical protein